MLLGSLLWVLALGSSHDASAQAIEPAAGLWAVRWAQAVRVNADLSVEIQRWGDGELELSVDGETVTGRWTTSIVETVNWSVSGTLRDGLLRLEATENDSTNPELDIVERLVITAHVQAGEMEGEIAMWFRGRERDPAPRPFTARRATGLDPEHPSRDK